MAKLDASLDRSLRSPLRKSKAQRLIRELAAEEPADAAEILLRHYGADEGSSAVEVQALLDEISAEPGTMRAILVDAAHPDPLVRRGAVGYLKMRMGFHASTYASLLEQTTKLVGEARAKDIAVDDIQALMDVSEGAYLAGSPLDAIKDMAACLELIKHRKKATEALRSYVTQMLKMAPDLTRFGAYDERLGEPLRKAIAASKSKEVDETKDIITLRSQESEIRSGLDRIGRSVEGSGQGWNIRDRPSLSAKDAAAMSHLKGFVETAVSLAVEGRREEGLAHLRRYLEEDYPEFYEAARERIDGKDQSALSAEYSIGLATVKTASLLLPQAAEDVYQRYYRGKEPEPSIHVVPWPEIAGEALA